MARGVIQSRGGHFIIKFSDWEDFMKEDSSRAAQHIEIRGAQAQKRILVTILLSVSIFFVLSAAAGSTNIPKASGAATATVQTRQEALSGTWAAEVKRDKAENEVQFTFNRRSDGGHSSMSGSGISLASLQGLTREQVFAANNTQVSFRLAREAGTIECRGSFRDGKGAGDWRLIPNETFRSAMRARGFDDLTDEQMFTSVMIDVTSKFVDDFKSIGFEGLTFKDVVKGRIFNVTPQFAAEMKSLGFDNLSLEELVKARIFKIDTEFVREVQGMGFERQSLEGLVKLRIFKITPEFISAMKSA
ncbi:MAG TPA: hypothetical protein VF766_15965, partial [Pyrinomonadaceae bacterium]